MKVLLATDGSKFAEDAAWFLSHLPHADHLDLCVLAVHEPLAVHGTTEVMAWMDRQQQIERSKLEEGCRIAAEMFEGADVSVETMTCEGHAAKKIVQLTQEKNIDLVVLGAEGHSTVERILLGSVSDFVATHADCSVLIVRPTGLREREHQELNISVAYDGSEPAKHAIQELKQFQWHHHTQFSIASVIEFPTIHLDVPINIDMDPVRAAMEAATQEAASELRSLTDNVESSVIDSSHVGDSIVRHALEQSSDLIVIGGTGLGLVGQFLLGSVSRYVVRHANCSVWITREPSNTE